MFREKNKQKTLFYELSKTFSNFAVSTITRFEIFAGQTDNQNEFWQNFYKRVKIYDFNDKSAFVAGEIVKQLKRDNKMIEISDILIASTAITYNLPIATLNINHFGRIKKLKIINK